MSVDRRLEEHFSEVKALREQLAASKVVTFSELPMMPDLPDLENAEALRHAGGGGTSGGMEERVIRLEGDVGRLKDDVSGLRADVGTLKVDVATLRENVRHLPGKGFVVTSAVSTVAAITGLLILLQRLGVLH